MMVDDEGEGTMPLKKMNGDDDDLEAEVEDGCGGGVDACLLDCSAVVVVAVAVTVVAERQRHVRSQRRCGAESS